MSSRQQGNRNENLVAKYLEDTYGYFCYPSRGSRGIDLVCLAPTEGNLPHLGIEVGTRSKSVAEAFRKIRSHAVCPGMLLFVVRRVQAGVRMKLRWHAQAGKWGHDSFEAALEEARSL